MWRPARQGEAFSAPHFNIIKRCSGCCGRYVKRCNEEFHTSSAYVDYMVITAQNKKRFEEEVKKLTMERKFAEY